MDTHWFKDSITYQILIDRFSRGKSEDDADPHCHGPVFCGGNLRGIHDRLDYLAELGVNTVWLSPFNSTASYHGYHITNFFDVDPRFGSIGSLKQLLDSAHRRGIRILMDFVANHVHRSHPIFKEASEDPASKYRDWFFFNQDGSYLTFLTYTDLPKLNLDNNEAADYITRAAIYWLDMGIDGLRLDHVIGPSSDFWRRFAGSVKSLHPKAVLIGEAFFSGISWRALKTIHIKRKRLIWILDRAGKDVAGQLMRQYVGVLDGVLDFRFQNLMKRFVARPAWYRPDWQLRFLLKRHYRSLPNGFYLAAFLDNHDMSRFLYEAGQDKNKLMRAARIQFAQSQPLVIYYGTEVGMTQFKPTTDDIPHSDLYARDMMIWKQDLQDRELLRFYREIIRARRRP